MISPGANLACLLLKAAARFPDRPALRQEGRTGSYAELEELSARVVALLRSAGVQPGDRVGLMAPNTPAFPVLCYGLVRAGAVVVPMNPLLKAREVEFLLSDCGARLLLAHDAAAGGPAGATSSPAGGGAARLRGGVRPRDPGGIRADRDLPGGLLQPPRPAPSPRHHRNTGGRRRASGPGRRRRPGPGRNAGGKSPFGATT